MSIHGNTYMAIYGNTYMAIHGNTYMAICRCICSCVRSVVGWRPLPHSLLVRRRRGLATPHRGGPCFSSDLPCTTATYQQSDHRGNGPWKKRTMEEMDHGGKRPWWIWTMEETDQGGQIRLYLHLNNPKILCFVHCLREYSKLAVIIKFTFQYP